MRFSTLFLKTQKEFPKDETAVNARLLIKGNFVEKLMAGVFSFLPLGFRVIEKIKTIVREEMHSLGAEEVFLPALHPRTVWEPTGRWQGLKEIMYQFKDRSGKELGLGPTHEEVIASVASKIIFSYKDLPRAVFQIQGKFRHEPRAKSGLLRGREFTMKDLYSFHGDNESLGEFYEQAKKAYQRVFKRCGLQSVITEASGGIFSKEYSHEFMVPAEVGEDQILLCGACGWARNIEIVEKSSNGGVCPRCGGELARVNAIEVGNIFKLGTKFSEPIQLRYKTKTGEALPVVMGSYGIGIERLMGTVVEVHHDEQGIIWPASIAPLKVHLIALGKVKKLADRFYNDLIKTRVEVLYDDREDVSAGEKFKDADLLGLPIRAVLSEKTMAHSKVEIKKRSQAKSQLVSFEKAHAVIAKL